MKTKKKTSYYEKMNETQKKAIYKVNAELRRRGVSKDLINNEILRPKQFKSKRQVDRYLKKFGTALEKTDRRKKEKVRANGYITNQLGYRTSKKRAKAYNDKVKEYNKRLSQTIGGVKRRKNKQYLDSISGKEVKIGGTKVQGQGTYKKRMKFDYIESRQAYNNSYNQIDKELNDLNKYGADYLVDRRFNGVEAFFKSYALRVGDHEFISIFEGLSPMAKAKLTSKFDEYMAYFNYASEGQMDLIDFSDSDIKNALNELKGYMLEVQAQVDKKYKDKHNEHVQKYVDNKENIKKQQKEENKIALKSLKIKSDKIKNNKNITRKGR